MIVLEEPSSNTVALFWAPNKALDHSVGSRERRTAVIVSSGLEERSKQGLKLQLFMPSWRSSGAMLSRTLCITCVT